jgi:hypothetical protein
MKRTFALARRTTPRPVPHRSGAASEGWNKDRIDMSTRLLTHCLLAGILAGPMTGFARSSAAAVEAVTNSASLSGPHIEFTNTIFNFGKVSPGEVLKHDFVFSNTGSQLLEISEIRPSCGCTTAGAWDKKVEPGRSGKISVQFNSGGYGGAITKTLGVLCNDPAQSNVTLQITGVIWRPIDIIPAYAIFSFGPDTPPQSNQTRVLRIVNNLEEPVTISDPVCNNPVFQAALKTVKAGKEFELQISANLPMEPTNVAAPIVMKTSAAQMPILTITPFITVQPAVAVTPPQLTLPTGPLTNSIRLAVIIQNNSTNPLVLSDPAANVPGVAVQVKEVEAGRKFSLAATFPAGFEAQPGEAIEMRVKSNSPRFPLIKVPVYQPATVPTVAVAAALHTNVPAVNADARVKAPSPKSQGQEDTNGAAADIGRATNGLHTGDAALLRTNAVGAPVPVDGPRVQFAGTVFDYGKVESGELVKHDFIFTNTGNQTLEIREVRPGCGCTTAGSWDKLVEPGRTGKIPVQFNSASYSGLVQKTIFVSCNDASRININLQLSGTVWKPIDISPANVVFNFGPDIQTNETRVVRILSNLEEPVTVSEPTSGNPAFRAELRPVKAGKEYELHVTAVPPLKSPSVSAPITLKTSYAKMPVVNVTAFATVQPAVTVSPSQFTLPPGPLTNRAQLVATIQNNGTNPLVLSEPGINAPGANVEIKELQTGRQFNLTLTFPAGFQNPPGQTIEARVKSNDPRFPLLKVGVFQIPSPPVIASQPQPSSPGTNVGLANDKLASSGTGTPAASSDGAAAPKRNDGGPKIQFAQTAFDFGRVESGKVVAHDFVYTNTGDHTLQITDVRSSCGCTAATNWAALVEPGKTGTVPVLFNTGGMAGPVAKTLWVSCNDPGQSNVLLQIAASVWKPIDALPGIATFTFGPDFQTNQTRVIRLLSNLDGPVTLSNPVCTNQSFRAELKTVREGREYELSVTVVPPLGPGSIVAPITLATSSSKIPVVTVTAYALVQPSLTMTPPRVVLPPLPLSDAATFNVVIQNRSTNSLVLSEPAISAKDASISLIELQPGRLFRLTLTFPAGFQSQAGRGVEARVRSNHPQYPYVRVPVAPVGSLDADGAGLTGDSPSARVAPGGAAPVVLEK